METVETLTNLASALEEFFTGLSECGLLANYSVQLHLISVDFIVQIKFRYILLQFEKSLQELLLKIPAINVGLQEECSQASQKLENDTDYEEIELPYETSLEPETEQFVCINETCVFTQSDEPLIWIESCEGDEEKHINSNLSENHGSNGIGSKTDDSADRSLCATNESGEQCLTFNDQKNSLESVVTLDELKPFIASHHHEFMASKTVTDNYPPSSVNLCSYDEIEGNIVTEEVNVPANEMHIVVASTNHQNDEECVLETENDKNKSPVFVCDLCKKNFSTARSLEIHRSLKHRNNGQCDMCPMSFASVQSLQEHCSVNHGGTGCFNCPDCGKRFMTKLSYKRHVDTHGGKKGAVCDMCGKTFSRTDYLQKHYMTHSGTRPFACSLCPRKFICSSQLKVHERIHSGVKDHVCDVCNKAFSRTDKLKDHMLRHLNIKRYQCSICDRYYAERRDLNKHLKVHAK